MIYLIRHGETDRNRAHLLQGRSDVPLNETGIQQARDAAQFLKERGIEFSRVFSSPLIRAVETAKIVAPGVTPVLDDRLLEMDYGPYEGMDLAHPAPEIVTFFRDFVHNPAPEGMEPLSDVTARVGTFLEDVRDLLGNILISTHAIAMKGGLEYLTPDSHGAYWSRFVGNCAIFAVDNSGGRFGLPEELKKSNRRQKLPLTEETIL